MKTISPEELEKDYYADRPTEPYCDDDSPNDWANIAHYAEENLEKAFNRLAELEAQIKKLIDFVLSKTECCDVCPMTDTCINSEGVCPYAGMLAKGEEEVTREWLMELISRR